MCRFQSRTNNMKHPKKSCSTILDRANPSIRDPTKTKTHRRFGLVKDVSELAKDCGKTELFRVLLVTKSSMNQNFIVNIRTQSRFENQLFLKLLRFWKLPILELTLLFNRIPTRELFTENWSSQNPTSRKTKGCLSIRVDKLKHTCWRSQNYSIWFLQLR